MTLSIVDKNDRELRIFDNADELSSDLADYISELSEASVKKYGMFSIAISGGSLINLIRKLCEVPHSKIVEWSKWHVYFADEHVASKSRADSNYRLVSDGLITKVPINYDNIHSVRISAGAEEAAEAYQWVMRQLCRARRVGISVANDCPRFDLVLLGMGPDGHVAALFPEHPALDEKEQWVTFVTNSPEQPVERITLTLPVINSASNVVVVATGEGKAEAVRQVIDGVVPDARDLPAGMVRPGEGKLVWFMDADAAAKVDVVEFK